jgi:hypothetical protein
VRVPKIRLELGRLSEQAGLKIYDLHRLVSAYSHCLPIGAAANLQRLDGVGMTDLQLVTSYKL